MEHQGDKQYVFNNDLCRTLELTVSNMSVNVNGVQGIEYKVDELFLANSTTNPKNSCFDKGNQSLPNGVFNASACRFGAPIYMSQPHFYQADPYYASLLAKGSVQPNKTAHETVFIFEPVSGVAMKVLARFQVNIKMDKIKELSAFKKLGGTFFLPTIWFETAMVLPQQLTDKMWYLSNLRLFMMIAAGVLMAIGIVMFMYGAFHYCSAVRAEYAEMDSEEPTADTTGTAKAENESDEANESLDRSHTDAE
jgi:scavenger receptor class B protein 1